MQQDNMDYGLSCRLTQFVKGLLIGFFSVIPFFDTERLREVFTPEGYGFSTYPSRVNRHFSLTWIISSIASFIGILCFFYVPFSPLLKAVGKPICLFLMALSVGFVIVDLYLIFRKHPVEFIDKKKILFMVLSFLVGVLVPFVLSKFSASEVLSSSLLSRESLVLCGALMLIGGLFSQFSGYSIGSVLVVSSSFLPFADHFYSVMRFKGFKESLPLIAVLLVSYLVGDVLGYCLKARKNHQKEKTSMNLGLTLMTLYLFYTNSYQNASFEMKFEDEGVTQDMRLLLTLTLLVLGIVISLIMSLHCYRFLNRKESKEELKPNYLLNTLTDDLSGKGKDE